MLTQTNRELEDDGLLYSQTNRSYAFNNNDLQSMQSTKRTLKIQKNLALNTGNLCKTSERTQANNSVKSFEEQLRNIEIDLITDSNQNILEDSPSIGLKSLSKNDGAQISSGKLSCREMDLLGRQASNQSMKSTNPLNSCQRDFLQISISRRQTDIEHTEELRPSNLSLDQSVQSFKSGSGSLSDIGFSPNDLKIHQESDKENYNVANFKMQSARDELSFAKKTFKDQAFANERQINTAEMKKFLLQPDESYGSEQICSNFGTFKRKISNESSFAKKIPIM